MQLPPLHVAYRNRTPAELSNRELISVVREAVRWERERAEAVAQHNIDLVSRERFACLDADAAAAVHSLLHDCMQELRVRTPEEVEHVAALLGMTEQHRAGVPAPAAGPQRP